MKTLKLSLIALLIIYSFSGIAQVPGYLGKRLSVGYSMDVTPLGMNIFLEYGPIVKYNGKYSEAWELQLKHNFEIEYVVGKQVALSGSVGFFRTGLFTYDREPKFVVDEYPKLSSYYDHTPYYDDVHNTYKYLDTRDYDYVNSTNMTFKIGALFFSKSYLAPYGKATGVYILMNQSHVQYVYGNVAKDLTTLTDYGIMVTKSYRRIFYDSFILDWGFGFGLMFSPLGRSNNISEYNGNLQNQLLIFHGNVGLKYLIPQFKKQSTKKHS